MSYCEFCKKKKVKPRFCSKKCVMKSLHNYCKKHKISAFYNPELRRLIKSKAGKIGGVITQKLHKGIGKKNIKIIGTKAYWYNVKFQSNWEMLCAKKILKKPILGKNYQIKIDKYKFDFYPHENDKMYKNCFVEFHRCSNFIHPETKEQYYKKRRKILDKYGFKDKKLIIIENISKDINPEEEI